MIDVEEENESMVFFFFFKLNKKGEILTQAEYDSIHKDVAIGRENRPKIDDAIIEVYVICGVTCINKYFFDFFYRLKYLAREHWAHARNYTENVENELRHLFRRIEVNFYNYKNTCYSIYVETISSTDSTDHHST